MTELTDLSPTDATNTSITGQSLEGNVANMANMDNTLQAILGMLGRWTSGDTIASASTTDIGAQPEAYLTVSGTTTITAFGTVRTGTIRFLRFSGALTLTHNATSLILPGAANILTVAGDTAVFVSEGSGNWRCLVYNRNAAPQGWEKIAEYSPSALSSIDVTGLSAYTRLRISGYILPATDDVYAFARVSVDNGANFLQGASSYSYQRIFSSGGTLTSDVANDTYLPLGTVNVGNAAGEGIDFSVEISSFNKARAALGRGSSTHKNAAGTVSIGTLGTWCNGTTARDAIRIAFSSGNIASGFVTIEGWRG